MIAEGYYTGRGIKGQLAESGDKRTPKVEVLVEIADDGEHQGARLRWDGWLTDAAAPRTLESLRHLGWQGEMLTDLAGIDANLVQLKIVHEEYEDKQTGEIKKSARVAFINRLGGGAALSGDENRLEGKAAASLALRFRALARGIPATGGARAPAPSSARTQTQQPRPQSGQRSGPPRHAPDAPAHNDDDIPF